MSGTERWFGAVTADVMCDPTINTTAKAVYAALAVYADKETGQTTVGNERLGLNLNVSPSTIARSMRELAAAGVIHRENRYEGPGRQTSSITTLLDIVAMRASKRSR